MAVMYDGFSTTIGFASDSDIALFEKEVQPGGIAGGGEIDVTTMGNTAWRTRHPKSLKQMEPMNVVAAYDPAVYDEIMALVNVNNLITVTFPDSATLAFYGWLDEFVPNNHVEGEQPVADCVIIPSLLHSSTLAETAPAYSAPPP